MFSLTPGLSQAIAAFIGPGTLVTVIDENALKLGMAALQGHAAAEWLQAGSNQEALLRAAAPITLDGRTRGTVILEQSGDQMLDLRERALRHLFDMTLLATALLVSITVGIAARISLRIGRLRLAAGRISGSVFTSCGWWRNFTAAVRPP